MARRIEVELTSHREDGSWTWRAAGARQPRGVLDGALLPAGASVGTVLKAEAEIDVEGITITSVLPDRAARPGVARIEVIGPPEPERRPEESFRPAGDEAKREGSRRDRPPRN
nr:hypothetical protein [Acidimicrobiia bacterium]